MPLSTLPRPVLGLLAILPIALVVTAVVSAIPWLKTLPDGAAYAFSIGAAIFTIGWSLFVAFLTRRRQDEVERYSERVGLQYGFLGGTIAVALALCLPGAADVIGAAANSVAVRLKGDADTAPVLAFVAGMAALAFAQSIGAIIACHIWWKAKS